MSGPKGGGYSVRENRRREAARRAALLEELSRARAELDAAVRAAAAHAGAGADLQVSPSRVDVDSTSTASVEDAIRSLRAQADAMRRATGQAVAELDRRRTLDRLLGEVGPVAAMFAADAMAGAIDTSPATAPIRELIDSILAELDPDASEHQQELLDLAARLSNIGADEGRTITQELHRRVRRLNAAVAQRRQEIENAREAQLRLLGVAGASAEELRRRLELVIDTGGSLSDELCSQVDAVIEQRRRIEDRIYVADALRESLEELGYEVGDSFITDLGGDSVAYIRRPGWADHLLEVRLPEERETVVLSAVRDGDPDHQRNSVELQRDAEIEEEFCETFDPILGHLQHSGVRVGPVTRNPAGGHPMRIVDRSHHQESEGRRRRRTAPQAREVE